MKFSKFFKRTDTRGHIVKTVSGEWLVCDGVAMQIPTGVNCLGNCVEDAKPMFNAIITADTEEDTLELYSAQLPADGKPKDIVRIFKTDNNDRIGIFNADFGLLDRSDRLVYLEIEDDVDTHVFMLVTDHTGDEIIGFIEGLYV